MNGPVLRGDALTLSYHRSVVVREAALELHPGAVTALVGPNGSGKSTLLRALARLHAVDSGTVRLGDDDAAALDRRSFARRLTLLAQNRPVPGGVPVREVVQFGRHPHRGRWRSTDAEGADAVAWAMKVTGVDAMADRGVDELSGGEAQRVWLASCLAQRTDILLLDEPTNHLDLRYQVELLELIRELADEHGVAVGVVLHDLNHAADVADDVVLLRDGEVVAHGPAPDVLTSDRVSEVYQIQVEVSVDPTTGRLGVRPTARGVRRALTPA